MSNIEFAAKIQAFIANLQILYDAKRRKMLKKETQKDVKLDKNAKNNSFGECMHDNKFQRSKNVLNL